MSAPTNAQAGVDTAPASGPEPKDVSLAEQKWVRELRRLAKNHRHGLIPAAALIGTHAVGAGAAAAGGMEGVAIVAGGFVADAGAYAYAHKHSSGYDRVYAGIAAVGAAMFQAGIGVYGGISWAAVLWWIVGALVALPHWVRHSVSDPDVTAERAVRTPRALPQAEEQQEATEAPTEAPAEDVQDERQDLWDAHLAANGKPIPGSEISEFADFEHGWKAEITQPIGGHWRDVFDQRKKILSVYDLPDNRVYIESIPEVSVRKARMTVLTSNPLQESTLWRGPTLDPKTGRFRIMLAEDAQWMTWKLWNPGAGGLMGLLAGVTRSGKTGGLDVILTECAMSDRIEPLVIDGGGGASLPQWANRVAMFGETADDARKILRYALQRMEVRRGILKRQGGGSLEPRPGMPLLPIIMDEAHKRLISDDDVDNTDIVRMCEQVVQEGAKFGVILIFANQSPILKQLGNSNALRDGVASGNVIGLRTTEKRNEGMIVSGDPMPESLRDLPSEFPNGKPTFGLGYNMTGRKIRARIPWLENPLDWPVVQVEHEPEASRVALPKLGVVEEPVKKSPTAASPDDLVAHALADDCAKNPVAIMQATGLSMAEARAALKRSK
ncbi:hypothetical protein [Saccharopolyspora sp. 6V]|uniref:hypothetical protein n=1 Tax=Saccharopolyspora sp. 6V TaxID=2877239 RepID=UPI001CD44AE4|nr:hypothetical protein [Saccharopolyspora sp. 6V]MCA1191639.1 hypothetical protein [Saccharopolyspora sp. 6V]